MNSNDLFESIDIIVGARLKDLQMDRIKQCIVIDISEKDKGIYTVQFENVKFTANGWGFSLNKGDSVYVAIPEEDYSNAFIVNKKQLKTSNEQQGRETYENFAPVFEYKNESGIITVPTFAQTNYLLLEATVSKSEDTTIPFGFLLTILVKEANYTRAHNIEFYSNEMLGEFKEPAVERKLFNIKDIKGKITQIIINQIGDFTATDVKLQFGELLDSYYNEQVILFGDVTEYYEDLMQSLSLQWVYKDEEVMRSVSAVNDELPVGASIKWEKNNGQSWEEIPAAADKITCEVKLSKYQKETQVRAKVLYNTTDSAAPLEQTSLPWTFRYKGIIPNYISDINLESEKTKFSDFYQPTGQIIDIAESTIERKIDLTAKLDKSLIEDDSLVLKIFWYFPNYKTMLIPKGIDNITTTDKGDYIEQEEKIDIQAYTKDTNLVYEQIYKSKSVDLNLGQLFTIKNFYTPIEGNQNDVKVVLQIEYDNQIIQSYEKTLSFVFAKTGLTKNDAVINLLIQDAHGRILQGVHFANTYTALIDIYDCDGNKIKVSNVEYSWLCGGDGFELDTSGSSIETFQLSTPSALTKYCNILKIECKYTALKADGETKTIKNISQYFPIAIDLSEGYTFRGPTSIIYDSSGGNPDYYNKAYGLYYQLNGVEISDPGVTFRQHIDAADGITPNETAYPKLHTIDNISELVPNDIYINGATERYSVVAYKNNLPIWIQPIVITQQSSFSSYLEDWSGALSIDEGGNTILAARLGVGRVNERGEFSGVVLGDWNEKYANKKTGIYGLQNNTRTYGFEEDGTGFIGRSGGGQILFDGTQGTIKSGNFDDSCIEKDENDNYKLDETGKPIIHLDKANGTFFDLDNGIIISGDAYFKGNIVANSLILNDGRETSGDQINSNISNIQGDISKINTTLTEKLTDDILRVDVRKGEDFAEVTNPGVYSFKVSKNGLLTAANAIIKGTLYGNEGYVGCWHFDDDNFSSINEYSDGSGRKTYISNFLTGTKKQEWDGAGNTPTKLFIGLTLEQSSAEWEVVENEIKNTNGDTNSNIYIKDKNYIVKISNLNYWVEAPYLTYTLSNGTKYTISAPYDTIINFIEEKDNNETIRTYSLDVNKLQQVHKAIHKADLGDTFKVQLPILLAAPQSFPGFYVEANGRIKTSKVTLDTDIVFQDSTAIDYPEIALDSLNKIIKAIRELQSSVAQVKEE